METLTICVGYLSTNCYLFFPQPKKAIVMDPGGGFPKINAALKERGVEEIAIMLTHGHFDHTLAINELRKNYKSVLYVHKAEADLLNSSANLAEAMGIVDFPEILPDVLLEEGIVDVFGTSIQVLHTPGHTKGSVCYIIADKIYSGDTLFCLSYGRTDFPTGNIEDLKDSLHRLFALPKSYEVFPGHGDSTDLYFEKDNNPINRL